MMIGVRRIEHDGNPRVGGFERRDYARSGETRGGNTGKHEQNKTRRRKKEKKRHTR